MANQRLIEALEKYTGEAETLEGFVKVATEELGDDWVSTIYDVMADAPASIQERLSHAFNYNAATIAWNELQEYLLQETPLNYQETLERIPVLEHWLSFFGAVGEEALEQLKEKLRTQGEKTNQNTTVFNEPFAVDMSNSSMPSEPETNSGLVEPTAVTSEQIEGIFTPSDETEKPQNLREVSAYLDGRKETSVSEQSEPQSTEQMPTIPNPIQYDEMPQTVDTYTPEHQEIPHADTQMQPVVHENELPTEPVISSAHSIVLERPLGEFNPIPASEPAQNDTPLEAESEASWRVRKMFRQIDFIANIESWISYLCLDLGYTDYYNYRYYGFLVDVLDRTIADLQDILKQNELYDVINAQRAGGVQFLQNKLLAYQKQSSEAHEMLADYLPLVREDLSVDDLKSRLGGMDFSQEKEYLGPAPDGFEMIDDPYERMNEDDLKKEYEKIEARGNLSAGTVANNPAGVPNASETNENTVGHIKNTSQTPQNGVQRKMSFTFGAKTSPRPIQTDETAS